MNLLDLVIFQLKSFIGALANKQMIKGQKYTINWKYLIDNAEIWNRSLKIYKIQINDI